VLQYRQTHIDVFILDLLSFIGKKTRYRSRVLIEEVAYCKDIKICLICVFDRVSKADLNSVWMAAVRSATLLLSIALTNAFLIAAALISYIKSTQRLAKLLVYPLYVPDRTSERLSFPLIYRPQGVVEQPPIHPLYLNLIG